MSDSMANNMASPRSTRAAALERRRALSHNGAAALGAKPSAPARTAGNMAAMEAAGATGKSLSRARREALSQGGAIGLAQANSTTHTGIRVIASDIPTVTAAPVEAAAAAQGLNSPNGCGCKGKAASEIAEREQLLEAVCALVDEDPAAVAGPSASAVRKLCQERRRALSTQGKVVVETSCSRVSRTSHNSAQSSTMAGLSGRDAAQARREAMCKQGRGDQSAYRPSGRTRQKPAAPAKVEQGTTLSGTSVTGTQVERGARVTGAEPGSCRAITGTEYIGTEQYSALCTAIPEPAPAKVGVGRTTRGQRVSGVELGHNVKVTGDEHGTCKAVTGTEYLSADKFESFCATRPVLTPAKVSVAATEAGQRVSGTEVGRSARVTGDEPGSCRKLTGSQYYQPESFGSLCRDGGSAPHKVSVMSTLREHVLTGTETTPGNRVTGTEHGVCASVTGTESAGLAQYQACNRKPVSVPEKVGVMRTWHEQPVSGTSVERSSKVTGDEYGSCQPVTGTEYAGPDQYAAFCAPDHHATARALMASQSGVADAMTTGIRLGPDSKVTGSARGEGQVLSGTPYASTNQRALQKSGDGTRMHPLTRGPADAPHTAVAVPEVAAVRGNFSVTTPARNAQERPLSRVTGTAYGAVGRITGPVNLAAGLVSGTPEFRYRDEAYGAVPATTATEVPRSRLTGDGREGGFAITGAAWRRNESITGTEGTSTRRNPTLRGDQRGTVLGASQMKDRERPALPISRVTGSSGNDAKGSSITYSGGARG
ncbi:MULTISPECIES: CsoS2 family carboxysome shell protein [Acidithiobacillus]|uniref:CsoS2 family carboxysome shell protein n=1 Tax=Acidithiobacillus ferruginosus TaxID=3063951 RepID=A0ACD5IHL8_9PROT|nr:MULTISPECIES: CsoS2 family carboxysome shell protein [Acidithiobacillus]MCL5957328.1 CsoS2 family carboxysome shell protein [Gammaproteobacteria bacterium]MBU2815677.1 transcriptional initiation protein Tat [Acidithiobacillus ferruginosus]MCR1346823.1 CsoS2 family carboxysome shell protein [Acidithiobacillus ferrooxidans]MCR1354167.1 CsoS2 family carboxysome shell protein [Acidithiobacillus ferrooxidans]MDD5374608.1 CsoS2 family carboxysome shell protein [Acidithiobacillus sp.]